MGIFLNVMNFLDNFNLKKLSPFLLPALGIFLIVNANIKKEEDPKLGYWPVAWKDFKKSKELNPNSNERKYDSWRKRVTIYFSSDLGKACQNTYSYAALIEKYHLQLAKEESKIYYDAGKQHVNIYSVRKAVPNEIHDKLLKKYTQTEIDKKFWAALRIFEKNSQPLRKIKLRASQQYLASAIDVLRHAGYEDWKLYSRWNENGIADLLAHYVEKYIATKKTGWLNFDKFLYEKGIINQINTNNMNPYRNLPYELDDICKPWVNLGEIYDPLRGNFPYAESPAFGF